MINTIVEIEHKEDFSEQGFYSKSYLAFDKRLNRDVAVKDIIYENLTSDDDFEKYFQEAYKLSLAAHPRVLPVYYVGLDHTSSAEKTPRIVTQYFKNGSLQRYVKLIYDSGRTLALDEVIRFSHDILQGMIHLHSLDIMHLDLKASNIYIGDDNKLVIGDFGQSRFIKEGILHDKIDLYPALMPVEHVTKKALDKTADIYQFGLLLYSLVCFDQYRNSIEVKYKISTEDLKKIFREKPSDLIALKAEFKENMKLFVEAIKNSNFPVRDKYPYHIPSKIQYIIHKCLEPKVENRYNNFYEIQKDLNDFIFPRDVSGLVQNLTTKNIEFEKEGKSCIIEIIQDEAKYSISSTKNGRGVTRCTKSGIVQTKLEKQLFKFVEEI